MTIASRETVNWEDVENSILGKRTETSLPPWVKLPGLSSVITEFVKKAQEPDADASDLGVLIERDTALTCLLLRRVNSASQALQCEAKSAQEAIVRLGIRGSVIFLLTEGMKQILASSKSRVMNMPIFYWENLERALFAKAIATKLKMDRELAFAGGLLCDCLLPIITNAATKAYFRFLEQRGDVANQIVDFEEREFGWSHALATALIFKGWSFPKELVCCVGLHHKGLKILEDSRLSRTSVAAVALAGLIPGQLKQSPTGIADLQSLESRIPGFNLQETADMVSAECREMLPNVSNSMTLAHRCKQATRKRSWFSKSS